MRHCPSEKSYKKCNGWNLLSWNRTTLQGILTSSVLVDGVNLCVECLKKTLVNVLYQVLYSRKVRKYRLWNVLYTNYKSQESRQPFLWKATWTLRILNIIQRLLNIWFVRAVRKRTTKQPILPPRASSPDVLGWLCSEHCRTFGK